jgi:hypothetical protein
VGGYLIFEIPTSSRYLKNSETKNCQFWVFKSFQNQRIAGFGYLKKKSDLKTCQFWVFQKLQRTTRFHQRTSKDLVILGDNMIFYKKNLRTMIIYKILVVDSLITMIIYQN